MRLTLHPRAGLPGQTETEVHVSGEIITVDGIPYDLSAVPEGGAGLPDGEGHPFVGLITRIDGVVHAQVCMDYDAATAEADQPADPAHWVIEDAAGEIELPVLRKPEPEGEDDDV